MKGCGLLLLAAVALPAAAGWEVEWRKASLPGLERQEAAVAVDREVRLYVAALGYRLGCVECRFLVYDDGLGLRVPGFGMLKETNRVNALPGGVVIVPLSLFGAVADEGEFAAAMARGIAHVALKHFERTAARASIMSPVPPPLLIFSRMMEREADFAAMGMLARAGFNPEALARHVKNAGASFDTSERRVVPVEEALAKLPPRAYCPGESPQFDQLKSRVGVKRAVV
jgi:predicted Zn-dependent protease